MEFPPLGSYLMEMGLALKYFHLFSDSSMILLSLDLTSWSSASALPRPQLVDTYRTRSYKKDDERTCLCVHKRGN
jgi:hypothetical protein